MGKHIDSLVEQIIVLIFSCRSQHDQQLKMKEESVGDLENKIKHLREELQEEREKYQAKVCHCNAKFLGVNFGYLHCLCIL